MLLVTSLVSWKLKPVFRAGRQRSEGISRYSRGSSEDMQVDQRVFLAANSSVKLCCACACTRDPHSQSVSGNVHPEPVNI